MKPYLYFRIMHSTVRFSVLQGHISDISELHVQTSFMIFSSQSCIFYLFSSYSSQRPWFLIFPHSLYLINVSLFLLLYLEYIWNPLTSVYVLSSALTQACILSHFTMCHSLSYSAPGLFLFAPVLALVKPFPLQYFSTNEVSSQMFFFFTFLLMACSSPFVSSSLFFQFPSHHPVLRICFIYSITILFPTVRL